MISPFDSESISHFSLHAFLQSTPLATCCLNGDGNILQANNAFLSLLGESRLVNFFDMMPPEDRQKLNDLFQQYTNQTTELGLMTCGQLALTITCGENIKSVLAYVTALVNGSNAPQFLLQLIDQTEQKNLEMRFSHSQKMQAVGQLAGGVAHDFNNLLTAMIGFCDLLLIRHPAGDPSFADIMQVKQNANRAANLVRQLLAFSRKQTLQPRVLDIGDVLAEISNLIRRLIGENIQMNLVHGRNVGSVCADQGQLEQVLINLAVNARDAMSSGGTLNITTSHAVIAPSYKIPAHFVAPSDDEIITAGEYVLVEISDTGTGIPPEIMKNIFEPFYSTKEVGSGTGLGLSTCYGIIKQTGGYIYVSSEVGKGTSFYVYLKKVDPVKADSNVESPSEAPNTDLTGKAKIMLVEDETPVRIFAARALRNKGYEVVEADSGETALEVFAKHAGTIDLIISDVVMPGMTGPNMLLQLEKNYAEAMKKTAVVFISGYAEDAFADSFGADRTFDFLAKPFTLKQLAGKVKDVLGGHAQG